MEYTDMKKKIRARNYRNKYTCIKEKLVRK